MRIDVALYPAEPLSAPLGVVVDVLRCTSTIAQALAAGYERVLCCEVDDALALRGEVGAAVAAGERDAGRIEGFDLGVSPRDVLEARAETLVLGNPTGSRAIRSAVGRCDEVLLGSLLNLDAVVSTIRARDTDVALFCAGWGGGFALDDAYCAGRIVALLDGELSDAAVAATLISGAFATAEAGLAARGTLPSRLDRAELEFCARTSVLDVVPRVTGVVGPAVELRA